MRSTGGKEGFRSCSWPRSEERASSRTKACRQHSFGSSIPHLCHRVKNRFWLWSGGETARLQTNGNKTTRVPKGSHVRSCFTLAGDSVSTLNAVLLLCAGAQATLRKCPTCKSSLCWCNNRLHQKFLNVSLSWASARLLLFNYTPVPLNVLDSNLV